MNLRTVWQRLTRRPRTPPRGQPSAPPAAPDSPAAAPTPDPLGKQRRGYQDKSLRAVRDYDDKVLPLPDGRVVLVHDGDQAQVYGALPAKPKDIRDPDGPWQVYVDGALVAITPVTKAVSVEEMDELKGKGRLRKIRGDWNGEP